MEGWGALAIAVGLLMVKYIRRRWNKSDSNVEEKREIRDDFKKAARSGDIRGMLSSVNRMRALRKK